MLFGVRRSYWLLFWLCIIIGSNLIFSCQSEDCVSIFNNELRVGFYETDTLETGEIIIDKKDTTFYAVVADGNDSVFYDVDTTVSILTLPVDPAAETTRFELIMIDSIGVDTLSVSPLQLEYTYYPNPDPHTIVVSYRRFTRMITEECGVEIGFVDLSVDETTFAIYEIDSDRLSRINEATQRVNVEVYF